MSLCCVWLVIFLYFFVFLFFFFFQAEDGIRDLTVTGVQTCALPICPGEDETGYVKFLPDWASVNLGLSQGRAGGEGTVDHMGIQVDAPETVMVQLQRVKAAGAGVGEGVGGHCCPADQDKCWGHDREGGGGGG